MTIIQYQPSVLDMYMYVFCSLSEKERYAVRRIQVKAESYFCRDRAPGINRVLSFRTDSDRYIRVLCLPQKQGNLQGGE